VSKYIGPVCKLCRREGAQLYLKGERCYTVKCPFLKPRRDARSLGPLPPGRGPIKFRTRPTRYGTQLREKQKVRRIYGLMERQFKDYFRRAERMGGVTGANLLIQLERRLDNVVYRAGLATSRRQARELIAHRHFTVDGRVVTIASYQVKAGQLVEANGNTAGKDFFKAIRQQTSARPVPRWLTVEREAGRAAVLALPTREDIQEPIDEQQIVNLYSR